MSKVRLTGATSGYTELAAPATAGNNTLVLPGGNGTAGQVLQTNGSGALSWAHGAASGPAFSATRTATQSVTPTIDTKVQLNIKEFDTNNAFDAVTNFRFTPQVAGYYQFNFSVNCSAAANNVIAILRLNGSNIALGSRSDGTAVNSTGSALLLLNGSTDYVELWGYLSGGSFQNSGCRLSGFLARPA